MAPVGRVRYTVSPVVCTLVGASSSASLWLSAAQCAGPVRWSVSAGHCMLVSSRHLSSSHTSRRLSCCSPTQSTSCCGSSLLALTSQSVKSLGKHSVVYPRLVIYLHTLPSLRASFCSFKRTVFRAEYKPLVTAYCTRSSLLFLIIFLLYVTCENNHTAKSSLRSLHRVCAPFSVAVTHFELLVFSGDVMPDTPTAACALSISFTCIILRLHA